MMYFLLFDKYIFPHNSDTFKGCKRVTCTLAEIDLKDEPTNKQTCYHKYKHCTLKLET